MRLMEAQLAPDYNCAHFLCDAWEQETGNDLRHVLGCFLAPVATRTAAASIPRGLRLVRRPQSPCVVLWRVAGSAPHVGLFVRGRVLHLSESGARRQLLAAASVGYDSVRFYVPR